MPLGTAAALAIGSVGSAVIGSGAASSAANKQVDAARDQTELQKAIYQDTTEKLEPFRQAGDQAFQAYLSELGLQDAPEGYGGYEKSPMARYLLDEGTEQIDAQFAARGGYNSGAALEALEQNRQRVITADTDRYFDRLLGTAGMGFDAATGQGSAGRYYATQSGAANMNAANAAGQYGMMGAQSLQTGIGDLAGTYGYFNQSNPMAAYSTNVISGNMTRSPFPRPRPA